MNDRFFKKIPLILLLIFLFAPLLKTKIGFIIIILILFKVFFDYFDVNKFKNKYMGQTIEVGGLNIFKKIKNGGVILGVLIIGIALFASSIVVIDAGETGVFSLFGKVSDQELSSGFHIINPFGKVEKMTIRTQDYTMTSTQGEGQVKGVDTIAALTKEGLSVDLDVTILYRLNESNASDIYKDVGTMYDSKIIRPAIRSTIRKVVAQYDAKVIYSEKRSEVTAQINKELIEKLKLRGIIIEDTMMRNITLPLKLSNSIEEKLQAEQEAKKMEFVLDREKKEKERKIIEAEGQKESQEIINKSLTSNYLQYLYIKNLENRAGTIYVPTNPENGMPMFKSF